MRYCENGEGPDTTAPQESEPLPFFTQTLPGNDERFRLLFENSLDAILIADDTGRFLDANAPACDLFGYSREQMLLLRVGDLMTLNSPDSAVRYERYLQTGREAGEFIFVRPDNEVRMASYSACRLAPGQHLSILRDITERKRAEQVQEKHAKEIEALNIRLKRSMMETHHRVKNNLQLIAALIDVQKQNAQDMVPLSEMIRLGHNIQALGVIHDVLTQEVRMDKDTGSLSVKTMLERFLPILESTLGVRRLRIHLEELSLPGQYVAALALIANELVSNAVKHGTGDVEFSLHTDGNKAALEVCDDGPGFPEGFDPQTAAHTGLELVENIARHDLRAEISYENRPQGGARIVVQFLTQDSSAP